jgi:hypothetical protein
MECRECHGALVEQIGERKSREKDALLMMKLLLLLEFRFVLVDTWVNDWALVPTARRVHGVS